MSPHRSTVRRAGAVAAGCAVVLAPLVAAPAFAAPDGSGVVINEVYARGGSANQPYTNKFVELFNPTDAPVSLAGLSLQYRSATGTGAATGVVPLSGTIPANGYFLVGGGTNGGAGEPLPEPDLSSGFQPSGTTGTVALVEGTQAVTLPTGNVAGAAGVVDLVGYGTSNTYEGSGRAPVSGGNTTPQSWTRTNGADTDDNAADFTIAATPTPQSSGTRGDDEVVEATIAEIQGTGAASPLVGRTVVTRGVVTAAYPTGGFDGVYLQTPGTGGDLAGHEASDGVFVFSGALARAAQVGQYLEVTGEVSEYFGLTEVTATEWTVLDEAVEPVVPAAIALPATEADREAFEGMLVAPQGDFTVTDTYDTNRFGLVGLAAGTTPLVQPSDVANPVTDRARYDAVVADNAARAITLDDGAGWDYTNFNRDYHETPLPYLSLENPLRVGAAATITDPVVLDYRFQWNFQPTTQVTGDNGAAPATFTNTREAAPAPVGGDLQIASFNVLNYFTTTGDELAGCQYYTDRHRNPISVRTGCDARGAADDANLERQQAKIVAAINALGAEVVSLEEIENSARLGADRDAALADLTAALNAAAGAGTWAYVKSPAALPADEDVIRTAFIYRADRVVPVGESHILIGEAAFANAREPLAQTFRALNPGGQAKGPEFAVVSNHFKSKGSGEGPGNDRDEGQGLSNADRVRQAQALVAFAADLYGPQVPVFLVGDFNSYTAEDPLVVLEQAGYTNIGQTMTAKDTYSFDGLVGSLDHVFANPAALGLVTGADIWNVNSGESVGLEYSRYNYNVTNLYDASPFRSSDHDPVVVGLDVLPGEVPDRAWERGRR
ncbi:ExeM/NucH family extracellular endonuclease [Georgenia thermotolerans]|uniref:ExeM/NucH family extracellular endonuclease n=1 Tax=Georgenia thermotolerans TaxID=527326 RepID=A0A7J5UQG3_9MICO|nr:ExeM/NucH family extracellular endonuclease [Georgenia thermotolerans]KAE8764609.1 ExeM/NucH family extracellular endonuclease [Georgenia thermotolerans]